YTGTLILISHYRYFIQPILDKILSIEQEKLFEFYFFFVCAQRQLWQLRCLLRAGTWQRTRSCGTE
ncbi:hypothetical protein E4T85_22295, partial [Bacillus stratosphericus]